MSSLSCKLYLIDFLSQDTNIQPRTDLTLGHECLNSKRNKPTKRKIMFGSGSIETMGLNGKLRKKLFKGISVSKLMICLEIKKYKELKIKVRNLKKKLKKMKSSKEKKNTQEQFKIKQELSRLKQSLSLSKVVKPLASPWTISSISNSE